MPSARRSSCWCGRTENAANLEQKTADFQAKTAALDIQRRCMEHLKSQLAACTITAPADGLVVYASSADRNAQAPIQEAVYLASGRHCCACRIPVR